MSGAWDRDDRWRENDWRDPDKLIRHLEIDDPVNIDIEAIAEYCGATILYDRLHGCEGRIVSFRDRAVITVDKSSHPFRQRFSAAHELGHWIFDRGARDLGPDGPQFHSWPGGGSESLVNEWAAGLLMPESLFVPDAVGRELTFATVRRLARRFRTSLTATAFRLIELGSYPGMLVCSQLGREWRWFKSGAHLDHGIYPRDEPGPESVAYQLLRGSRNVPGSVEVPANAWITRPDSWWFTLREDSVPVGNGDILSLLWWTETTQLEFATVPGAVWLPWTPGGGAVKRLVKTLREKWGWRRVRGAPGRATLETDRPSFARIVLPDPRAKDAEGFRAIVGEIARHHGVTVRTILGSMVEEIEKEVRAKEVTRRRELSQVVVPLTL